MTHIAQGIGLALLLVLPAFAQIGNDQAKPDLKGSLGGIPTAPTPIDQYGNPITPQQPTAAEREAALKDAEQRTANALAQEERDALEARLATDERLAAEHLAEEQRFHNRIMTAFYVGIAIIAVWAGSRFLKRS